MEYTNSEYCDMLFILGQCNNEAIVTARRYAEIYPHRRHPDAKVIRRAETRLRETGSVIIHRSDVGRGQNVRMIRIEEEIIRRIQEEPRKSIRFIIKLNECAKIEFIAFYEMKICIHTIFLWYNISEKVTLNVVSNLSVANIWKQQGQYILWPNFIFWRISIYSKGIVQCTQYALLGRRKSLRNQRKKFPSLMEFKYLDRNYRKWVNWTLYSSEQDRR